MDKNELQSILVRDGISSESYDLNGGSPNEKYCLGRDGRRWRVYYSERGIRTEEKVFDNESKACEYLLGMLRKDMTTK